MSQRISRGLGWMITGLWVFSASALAQHEHHGHHADPSMDKNRPAPLKGRSIYQLDSQWKDQAGKSRRLVDFRGKKVVTTMAYTSCTTACPVIMADLKKIEKALPAALKKDVHFVVISMDPARDTPARLAEFAKKHGVDPARWTFLTGTDSTVREVAAVFGIRYKRDAQGEYSHSNVITVLDREGLIQHQQTGLNQDPKKTVEALKR